MGHQEFIKILHNATRDHETSGTQVHLDVYFGFLDSWMHLDESASTHVLTALKTTPLQPITFQPTRGGWRQSTSPAIRRQFQRLDSLWDTLGAIINLEEVVFDYGDDDIEISPAAVLPLLRHISLVNVRGTMSDASATDLAIGLASHPSIRTIRMNINKSIFTTLLPVLQTMPALTRAEIGTDYDSGREMSIEAATALADLLRADFPLLCIKLSKLDFLGNEVAACLPAG